MSKSYGTVMVLAIVLGVVGLLGVAHIYMGRVAQGVVLLVAGLALGVAAVFVLWTIVPYILLLVASVYDARRIWRTVSSDLD